jgi:hypothetical protein
MAEKSRGLLIRKRTILGAVLVAGIGLGIFLNKLGFDFGFGKGRGKGNDGEAQTTTSIVNGANSSPEANDRSKTDDVEIVGSGTSATAPDVVRVVIDDRKYLLRQEDKETPIELPQLIDLIKQAPGDATQIKARIYRKMTARMKTEEDLKRELLAAEIPDAVVIWVPVPLEKK